MWIKNKKTGVIWQINDEKMQKRLLKDTNYIESRKSTAKKAKVEKEAE